MRSKPIVPVVFLFPVIVIVLAPAPASAYGGPGSVISGIGALLALLAALVASLFGFVWYPLKMLVRRIRDTEMNPERRSLEVRQDLAGE